MRVMLPSDALTVGDELGLRKYAKAGFGALGKYPVEIRYL